MTAAVIVRAKSGEKTGAGGHQQNFGQHGKYTIGIEPFAAPVGKPKLTHSEKLKELTGIPTSGLATDEAAYAKAKAVVQLELGNDLIERAKTSAKLAAGLQSEAAPLLGAADGPERVAGLLAIDRAEATRLITEARGGSLELGARLAAQRHLDEWAATSGDSSPYPLATQKLTAEKFGVDATWINQQVQALDTPARNAYIAAMTPGPKRTVIENLIDIQYDNTQQALAKAGIDELTLCRGVQSVHDGPLDYQFSPLSSWTTDEQTADEYAASGGKRGTTFAATIPRSRIVSTFATGQGMLTLDEFVVLGAPNPDTIHAEDPKL